MQKGPCFGNGELYVGEPFNRDNKCNSFVKKSGYNIGQEANGNNTLTNYMCKAGGYCSEFTLIEIEVWKVIFQ